MSQKDINGNAHGSLATEWSVDLYDRVEKLGAAGSQLESPQESFVNGSGSFLRLLERLAAVGAHRARLDAQPLGGLDKMRARGQRRIDIGIWNGGIGRQAGDDQKAVEFEAAQFPELRAAQFHVIDMFAASLAG